MQSTQIKSRRSDLFQSQIFHLPDDQEIFDFYLQPQPDPNPPTQEEIPRKSQIMPHEQKKTPKLEIGEPDQESQQVSRLALELARNNLKLPCINGQIFIALMQSVLAGRNRQNPGFFMVTNYRIVFFKKGQIRVEAPFGIISKIQSDSRRMQVCVWLKYPLRWKFMMKDSKQFQKMVLCLEVYSKTNNLRSYFAFAYAIKHPNPICDTFDLSSQYARMKFNKMLRINHIKKPLIKDYPPQFYMAVTPCMDIVMRNYRQNRLPILTFLYRNINKERCGLWRASSFIEDHKSLDIKELSCYLKEIASYDNSNNKIIAVEISSSKFQKPHRVYDDKSVRHFLSYFQYQLPTMAALNQAYNAMIDLYLTSKDHFIKQMLNTKYPQYLINIIDTVKRVCNGLYQLKEVIVVCEEGIDYSAVVSALAQVVVDPYYRTIKGFQDLVMKEFVYMSHPFAERFGHRCNTGKPVESPIFIYFLDAVGQLLAVNPLSFAFNYKYLAKLSQLMYTMTFSTFLTNSVDEYLQIKNQALPIWPYLLSSLTENSFYQSKSGPLNLTHSISDLRIWKEHFFCLFGGPKDAYKLIPDAQDNQDYVNLSCKDLQVQNQMLKKEITNQKERIAELQTELCSRKCKA